MKKVHLPKGLLELYLLSILNSYPAKGIEIIESVKKNTDGGWVPSAGSIYPLLKKLESQGFIYKVSSDNRYVITEKGKERIQELKEEALEIQKIIEKILNSLS